ncbi:unnamed protein product [Macrosiphum euphorbiae]|uniref:Uncharacterized protein n=1 Tax=Macrosiphum euphorbiae TaxID=13131 RepID=A0AAV0W2R4_9HEMI|nr:unnamed protein product [Macrosiphum euphorbiae]
MLQKWFSSLIYAGGQFTLFLVAYTFFDSNALLSFNKYVMYTYIGSCVISVAFVHFCLPETRGLPLDRVLETENNCVDPENE